MGYIWKCSKQNAVDWPEIHTNDTENGALWKKSYGFVYGGILEVVFI